MPINKVRLHLKMSQNEILDDEFLATVNRKWLKAPGGEVPDIEPLTFESEDRGVIKDDSGIGSSCSIHYLRCIKFNLLALAISVHMDMVKDMKKHLIGPSTRAGYNLNDANEGSLHDFRDKCLEISLGLTSSELDRLHEHPELFPSKTIEENFYYDVSVLFDRLLSLAKIEDDIIGLMSERHRLLESRLREVLLPAQDERRKPWQQFFHNNAPGSGIHPSRLTHHLAIDGMKITQAIPMTVFKLMEDVELELDEIRKELGIEKPPRPPPPVPLDTPRQKVTDDGFLRTSWMAPSCLPPVPSFHEARQARDQVEIGTMSLEKLNESFAILHGPVVPHWPTGSHGACFVVEERPFQVGVSGHEGQQK